MKREKFLGISFLKDENKDVAFLDVKNEKSKDEDKEGVPVKEIRKSILEKKASSDLKLSNHKFQQFLNEKGMFKESKEARGVDVQDIKIKSKKFINEASFTSKSMFEGFLSFYGIEMDKALDKYENRLHVIEEDQSAYIGKVSKDGELTKVSPTMEKEKAVERLREFEQKKDLNRSKERELGIELERKKEEEN